MQVDGDGVRDLGGRRGVESVDDDVRGRPPAAAVGLAAGVDQLAHGADQDGAARLVEDLFVEFGEKVEIAAQGLGLRGAQDGCVRGHGLSLGTPGGGTSGPLAPLAGRRVQP
ncbi:hypothetical protein GCM10025883_17800 [Mobilicoccus caccae]|uniref:Uncharacterized protein n=1 Tax=Mobilicoccus caccae TaxID=1859295 RepID=A0ABQ6IQW9_9MICO|nr:hypothetical protein GCM10025883_17800 [Mobilicoccus caccae]